MQVRAKLFPYPVINKNKALSNYGDLSFELSYEPLEDEAKYILKGVSFSTDSKTINDLYDDGSIKIVMVVECSDTVFRQAFEIDRVPRDVILHKTDFTERVDVSVFAYATKDFTLESIEFEEDYKGLSFEIEKYDTVAANDGFNVRFKHDETEGNIVQSIFSVIVGHDLEEGSYIIECNTGRKITITLSEKDFKNYKVIYTVDTYKEVFFNMLLVPALIEGLSLCKMVLVDEDKDLEDVGNQYYWFRSIQSAYKKLNGKDLPLDDFKKMSPASFAQEILGKPLGSSLEKLVAETQRIESSGEENE